MPDNPYEALTSTLEELAELGLYNGVGDVYVAFQLTAGTASEPPTYSKPLVACEAVSIGLTPGYAEGSQSASNRTVRKKKFLKTMDVKVEYPRMKAAVRAAILNLKVDANGGTALGDGLPPQIAVGLITTRDDGKQVMRWVYNCSASEGSIEGKTSEEGTIAYQIPTIEMAGVALAYQVDGEHLVMYEADTADESCKWTESTFFAAVVGPWSEEIGA